MKVVCVGASYKLKERAARTWKNKTVTEVAALIAKQFRMTFVGEPSSRRFEQLSMTGQSYWSWLQEYAAKIGYAFYVDNTTMYLRPIHKLLNESTSNAPVMGLELPSPAANTKAWDRTLDSFIVEKGDYFDGAEALYTTKVTSGVNPLTSKRFINKSSPAELTAGDTRVGIPTTIFEDLSTEVVHSPSFSKQTARDLAFAAKFVVLARLRGQGDPRIRPYGAVYVYNTGSETDGYWTINKSHHLFNITGLYEVSLEVATDGIGPNSGTTFRKAKNLKNGTIDIETILLDDLAGTSRSRTSARLISKTPTIKETDQGFGKSNAFWSEN
jgi:phage protein D